MQIQLDTASVKTQLGNKGIVLKIADNSGKHVGKLRIGQATVLWTKGKISEANGTRLPLKDLIDLLNGDIETLKKPKKAASSLRKSASKSA